MSQGEMKRSEPEKEHAQPPRFRRSHPEFQCSIDFKNPTPPFPLGPYFFDVPVNLDDGKRSPRPDAINYDACSYRLTEMESSYQFSLPPADKLFFMTSKFFDFVDDVEDWQPEDDKPCIEDLAPFLVSIEDLERNGGKMPPNMPKMSPSSIYTPKEKTVAPEPVPMQRTAPPTPKKKAPAVLPQTRSELAHAIEKTFNVTEFVHPFKTGLKVKRSTPILPATTLSQNVAHFMVDQEIGEQSLIKAMTSPSDPSETFIWLYAPIKESVDTEGRQVHQFQRDFTVQRNIRPENLFTLYYSKSTGEDSQLATITNQFNLRRNRGKASDSLRKSRPKLTVERIKNDS